MRTALTRLTVITATALVLTGCGGGDTPAADGTAGASASAEASLSEPPESADSQEQAPDENVITITLQGDQVSPNGDRVEVPLGEPVTFDITADRAGELHVHSSPEQELAFGKGDTQVQATFDKPGIVEVEDHESGKVVVQLQVS